MLAIDGGNSKTDVALVAGDGTLLASARGPGINAHEVGVDQTVLILDAVVKQAAAQLEAQLDQRPDGPLARHTVACLANADLPEEEVEHATAVQAQGWSESATVVNDTFAILRSGLPDAVEGRGSGPHWGVAVVCGAGINAVGVAPDGRVTRYLALGTISGDWGGGYGLGLEVLWHAIRAEDGRGPDTALAGYLTGHFGVERVEEVTIGIHKGKIPDDDLTGLAPMLLRASDEGDAVARTVVNRLADEISVMAITAMRRLGPDRPGHARGAGRRRHHRAEPAADVRHHPPARRGRPGRRGPRDRRPAGGRRGPARPGPRARPGRRRGPAARRLRHRPPVTRPATRIRVRHQWRSPTGSGRSGTP